MGRRVLLEDVGQVVAVVRWRDRELGLVSRLARIRERLEGVVGRADKDVCNAETA